MFGIPEAPAGDKEDCAEAVTRVLQTYIPEEDWDTNVIERAHRLGRLNPLNPGRYKTRNRGKPRLTATDQTNRG